MKKLTRSQGRLRRSPLANLRRLSVGDKLRTGRKLGGEYYVAKDIPKVTRKTPVITVSSWKDAQLGISHGKAAKMRKEKRLGYGLHGESEVAPQSVRTRERLAKPHYDIPTQHVYINTAGDVAHDFSWKHALRHMQDYQHALDEAFALEDGIGLLRFKHIKVVTYDGAGKRGYRNKGVRIYPEHRLDKIQERLSRMTDREKAQFEADRRYRERDKLAPRPQDGGMRGASKSSRATPPARLRARDWRGVTKGCIPQPSCVGKK